MLRFSVNTLRVLQGMPGRIGDYADAFADLKHGFFAG